MLFRVSCLKFRIRGFENTIWGFQFGACEFRFKAWILGFGVVGMVHHTGV